MNDTPEQQEFIDPRDEIVTHLPALRAFARGLTGDVSGADDLVQETVLKAWSKFSQYNEGTNLRAWLFTILRNTYLSKRRKQSREVSDGEGVFAARMASKPDHDGRLALQELNAAMKLLPVEQREALILVGAMGFSIEEAAQTCGCAPGTIKSRANRARKALVEILHLEKGELPDSTDKSVAMVMAGAPNGF
ncbi:sigma-70 family RNA polymerase sigma factor [Roseinatronobacter sp. S2]|uniref:sigma-70 family RNA polymerase sigma factor n=1 Tax=Roseinatronobacter sp. S2 TaxID=3035471 RepID=UPI00240F9DCF|nr:sigma-70 family RNA polymerase sigma factor [Roseinatronobacter sp. S2]WFE74327.1 sigma-70 family RNA polymerase sigma factor [Roseinatronobacter sp. S2]